MKRVLILLTILITAISSTNAGVVSTSNATFSLFRKFGTVTRPREPGNNYIEVTCSGYTLSFSIPNGSLYIDVVLTDEIDNTTYYYTVTDGFNSFCLPPINTSYYVTCTTDCGDIYEGNIIIE